MIIEVVAYNFESALAAVEGGADRIELCDNPAEGGTTPSAGMIEEVRKNVSAEMYVMVRPRGGDFHYSEGEFNIMKRDVAACLMLGADGVVFGILHPDGSLDKERCKNLIERARPLKTTCHRAFDMVRDPFEALEDCIDAGFDRILTSGLRSQALEGVTLISALRRKANGRISIMAGSRVNEETVEEIVSRSGVKEVHFSAVAYRESAMAYRSAAVEGMGSQVGNEYSVRIVEAEKVRSIRTLAERAYRKYQTAAKSRPA